MGCEQSTPVDDTANRGDGAAQRSDITGIGQTERQLSKMMRDSMNSNSGAPDPRKKSLALPKLDEQGFLTAEEVAKRTFSSIANKATTLGTIHNVTHLQFAQWTQRGYYPDDPHKQNQDEFGTHLQFAGVDRDAMFAVYDGHGKNGHACSQFARERLPKAIAKHVRRIRCQKYQNTRDNNKKGGWDPSRWPMLNRKEYEACCRRAFLEVNQAMHDEPTVPDSLSGTTATAVNFHGNFVSVSNVGDSRVVLGHRVKSNPDNSISVNCRMAEMASASANTNANEEEKYDMDDEISYKSGRLAVGQPVITPGGSFQTRQLPPPPGTRVIAMPLSRDQTPYRKDERERVEARGACIMTTDQMQGKEAVHNDWGDMVFGEMLDIEGDSPRVWIKGGDSPGCAFTRSLGDSYSEPIGIIAEPEILTTELTENDDYLVIASDGIFEFMTNQNVIDLCEASESPLMACEMIVKAAYQQWLSYENRTDDITIVVCFLQNFNPATMDGIHGTTEDLVEKMAKIYGTRPAHMPQRSTGGLAYSDLPSPGHDDRSSALTRSIASLEGTASIDELVNVEDEEVSAYHTEEARAVIVGSATMPQQMVFDDSDNYECMDFKIDALMEEVNKADATTSTSTGESYDHSKIPAVPAIETVNDDRNAIQI
ncbi:2C and cyclic nucleotide-binding/kinase domain-containing protein [Seminavis robusta]|uniref:2C and cyclic nucleotide-binding/kinase domain-containing protein n=1 Tax=Seminavis robusta TaxID=568900 RepID=A0A9N8DS94_9STRA|nr:2C and cyclic nucleotide-binding/kinase domain-containing protein [Seminavis robusta]|eukprot:Sro251_g099310.1 2C and cyclic nucleotide-binding/kinase domain-containing protein (652) ;mRNA; f:46872-49035